MNTWVELQNVEKKIDDFELGPIDFSIEPGTITALVGNNGSGKSTLLKLMMHLAKVDKGNIRIFDKIVGGADESWKEHVAYMPQTPIGYDAFTGEALRDLVSRWYPNWDNHQFTTIVKQMGVTLNKPFGKLSQGDQQKLSLALTIARNAELLILDEPTSFLDIPSKKILMDLLVNWMEQDEHAILMASHQSEDIKKLADYITVLDSGKLLGTFEKEELIESYQRYWFREEPSKSIVPGEVSRTENYIVSNQPEVTEEYFIQNKITWMNRTTVDLDETITLLLTKKI